MFRSVTNMFVQNSRVSFHEKTAFHCDVERTTLTFDRANPVLGEERVDQEADWHRIETLRDADLATETIQWTPQIYRCLPSNFHASR